MFFRAAFEKHLAVAQYCKAGVRILLALVLGLAAVWQHAVALRVEKEICQRHSVLQAVGCEQRRYTVSVAQAQDERDDGLRSYGIKPGRGRIVEDDGRTGDQGPGN